MSIPVLVSIVGAVASLGVSLAGALIAHRNNIILQIRKLKEDHYVNYLESLHYLAGDNTSRIAIDRYVLTRDKLFLIAGEDVIKMLLEYESRGVGAADSVHNFYLTRLIKSIRKDLQIRDLDFPTVHFRK